MLYRENLSWMNNESKTCYRDANVNIINNWTSQKKHLKHVIDT